MGGKIVLPEVDPNINKVIKNFRFTPKDISDFWKIFQKLDKQKTGLVPLAAIFKKIEQERNLITDCLLELLEIEHDGEINFSDFVYMVATYCFFEPIDILKFCFYVFDQDKTGFFSVDDLNNLVNAVHNIKSGNTVKGTVRASWVKLTFAGEEFEFEEFKRIHNAYPRLFEPAFRLHQNMMIGFMGEWWWNAKKQLVIDVKELADAKIKAMAQKKEKKKQRKKDRKTQRAMGSLRYFLCPCMRKYYDPSLSAYDKLSEEEKAQRDKEIAAARRQAELRVKNPETAVWLKYQKKIAAENQVYSLEEEPEEDERDPEQRRILDATHAATAAAVHKPPEPAPTATSTAVANYIQPSLGLTKKVVVNSYLDQKVNITAAMRAERAESRAERKARRDADPDLKQKARTTVSGAEF
eukprot:CAMPEP_0184985514 /NCGR_PEP_ID=MMETSP1098-20130426/14154_1 /TAXON_ID=89044 /ORGANISM="Spumella elongata, Strain CCAP 955/1" /LENGTH=409 /DNA_ID=CAMNT_0027509603 /DNA_START=91 /DNA_END=1320 /DNA_ORIENTATION=+